MQTCIWPSWCHCHSLSLASVKSRLVLPFCYWLTQVVLENGPLNGCVCVRAHVRVRVCVRPVNNFWISWLSSVLLVFFSALTLFVGWMWVTQVELESSPSFFIDSVWAWIIFWRLRGKIIRTVSCCVVYDSCPQRYKQIWAVIKFFYI